MSRSSRFIFFIPSFFVLAGLFTAVDNRALAEESEDALDAKTAALDISYSTDSDTISTRTAQLSGSMNLNEKAELSGGYTQFEMHAHQSSGLRAGNLGSGKVNYYHPWLGLRVPVYQTIYAGFKTGYETTDVDGKTTSWKAALDGSHAVFMT